MKKGSLKTKISLENEKLTVQAYCFYFLSVRYYFYFSSSDISTKYTFKIVRVKTKIK